MALGCLDLELREKTREKLWIDTGSICHGNKNCWIEKQVEGSQVYFSSSFILYIWGCSMYRRILHGESLSLSLFGCWRKRKKKWEKRIRNPAGKDRQWQRWSSTGCGGGGCQPEGGMQSNRITSKRGSEDGGGGTSSLVLLVPFSQSRKTMEPLQGGVSALYSGYFFHLLFLDSANFLFICMTPYHLKIKWS